MAGSLTQVTDRFITGPPGGAKVAEPVVTGDSIFLVHGHDKAMREEVARFLGRVLDRPNIVVILGEKANQGTTLIEKLEQAATTSGYAVVLLTGDDEGHNVGSSETELRARQNVVFELGFFFGKLGRRQVSVLYDQGVTVPSDVGGLVYIPLDEAGGWMIQLARELKSAGYDADMNRLTESR
jgi:predicted nucleotide-binding protein